MPRKSPLELGLERGLFAARWLLAPIYLGLVLALIMLLVIFVRELLHNAAYLFVMEPEEAILAVLSLIDISLAANLVIIVMYSGYENFVSRFDLAEGADRPEWMGTVDFSALKLKLVASIVAISGIHLLSWFLEIGEYESGQFVDTPQLRWLVIIHLTFVFAGVMLALMDWLASRSKH